MIKGKTQTGFTYSVDDDVMDDYDLLETLVGIDKGDYTLITKMTDMLLGAEQKDKLKEHIRAKNGKVSIKAMLDEVTEIFKASSSGKN